MMVKQKTPSTPVLYRDLNMFFSKHPSTDDVTTVTNTEAIKRSIKHLILTDFNERPFEPKIGSSLKQFFFDNATPFTTLLINNYIRDCLDNFEPRIKVINVYSRLEEGNNSLDIFIEYFFANERITQEFNIPLERVR